MATNPNPTFDKETEARLITILQQSSQEHSLSIGLLLNQFKADQAKKDQVLFEELIAFINEENTDENVHSRLEVVLLLLDQFLTKYFYMNLLGPNPTIEECCYGLQLALESATDNENKSGNLIPNEMQKNVQVFINGIMQPQYKELRKQKYLEVSSDLYNVIPRIVEEENPNSIPNLILKFLKKIAKPFKYFFEFLIQPFLIQPSKPTLIIKKQKDAVQDKCRQIIEERLQGLLKESKLIEDVAELILSQFNSDRDLKLNGMLARLKEFETTKLKLPDDYKYLSSNEQKSKYQTILSNITSKIAKINKSFAEEYKKIIKDFIQKYDEISTEISKFNAKLGSIKDSKTYSPLVSELQKLKSSLFLLKNPLLNLEAKFGQLPDEVKKALSPEDSYQAKAHLLSNLESEITRTTNALKAKASELLEKQQKLFAENLAKLNRLVTTYNSYCYNALSSYEVASRENDLINAKKIFANAQKLKSLSEKASNEIKNLIQDIRSQFLDDSSELNKLQVLAKGENNTNNADFAKTLNEFKDRSSEIELSEKTADSEIKNKISAVFEPQIKNAEADLKKLEVIFNEIQQKQKAVLELYSKNKSCELLSIDKVANFEGDFSKAVATEKELGKLISEFTSAAKTFNDQYFGEKAAEQPINILVNADLLAICDVALSEQISGIRNKFADAAKYDFNPIFLQPIQIARDFAINTFEKAVSAIESLISPKKSTSGDFKLPVVTAASLQFFKDKEKSRTLVQTEQDFKTCLAEAQSFVAVIDEKQKSFNKANGEFCDELAKLDQQLTTLTVTDEKAKSSLKDLKASVEKLFTSLNKEYKELLAILKTCSDKDASKLLTELFEATKLSKKTITEKYTQKIPVQSRTDDSSVARSSPVQTEDRQGSRFLPI